MDACIPAVEAVPVRRPKSWKREREETRAKHLKKPRDTTDILVWELPCPGMTTRICNLTSSQQIGNRLNETCVDNVQNLYCGVSSRKHGISFRRASSLIYLKKGVSVLNSLNGKGDSWYSINQNELIRGQTSKRDVNRFNIPQHVMNKTLKNEDCFLGTKTKHPEKGGPEFLITGNGLEGVCFEKGADIVQSETSISYVPVVSNCSASYENMIHKGCTHNSPTPESKSDDCSTVSEDFSNNCTGMDNKGYYLEINEFKETETIKNRSLSCHQKYKSHCFEHKEIAVRCVQSTPKLSSCTSENVKRNPPEIGMFDAYLNRKIHTNGSFGDVANFCKCYISMDNSNKDCVLNIDNNTTLCHSSECDYVHKYLLNSGLIGYIIGLNRQVETFNFTNKTVENVSNSISEDDRQDFLIYFSQAQQRIFIKSKLRSVNSSVTLRRPDDEHFSKLDSSLKKNTAFVRKLKTFTCSQLDSLLKDMSTLNLTKYVSEVATALVECKLKMSDVWAAVQICNIFHQTYCDFSTYFLENWQKVLIIKKDEPISNPAKLRVDLRFYAELISVGVFTRKEGLSLLGNILTLLTCLDKEYHYNIKILLSFCRHCGDEYAGLIPRKVRLLSEKYNIPVPQCRLLTEEKQHNVRVLFKDYYNSLCNHLLKEHRKLQEISKQNRKILHTKGELGVERKDRLEAVQVSFNQIATDTQLFAEALDEDFPLLPQDESLKQEGIILSGSGECDEDIQEIYLWDEEEERCFYECILDMKQFLPNLQVKVSEPEQQVSEETLDLEFEGDLFGEATNEEEVFLAELEEIEEPEPVGNTNNKAFLESFLSSLLNCITKELVDKAAVEFVKTLNTKYNRRKLVKALFTVPRIRLDLLPFYARFVATLYPVASDVAIDLAQMLRRSFKYHVRKKDQMNIESKIKVVRFIGELVKFHMYSKVEGLYCLKVLVQDFAHHHIEMCCNFLESCGRFFFRHPDCHQRMKIYLDQIMRKKAIMALDPRYVTMIENVYYYVNPPQETKFIIKERREEEEFIRMLLYHKLEEINVEEILCLMQKLDWDDPDIAPCAVKCLTRAFKVKYYNIRYMASLLAGLVIDREFEGTQVIDGVLEDIQLGLEVNLPGHNQRRLSMVKYLGELYNYRLVENSNVFRVLYSLITFYVTYSHTVESSLDPPENLFRIRLACTLLDTCGGYFNSGLSRKKLDTYLVFFQYYFWFKYSHPVWSEKNPFPCSVKYMFEDTVISLRPHIHLFTSLVEAEETVDKLYVQNITNEDPQYCDYDISMVDPNSDELDELQDESDESRTSELDQTDMDIAHKSSDETSNETMPSSLSKCSFSNEVDKEECNDSNMGSQCDIDLVRNEEPKNTLTFYKTESNNKGDIVSGPNLVTCPEDDEFLVAFDKMVVDNLRDRMHEIVKPQRLDISVPLYVKSKAKKSFLQLRKEEDHNPSVDFLLILRKGNKQQFKNLDVPVNSEIALTVRNHREAERVEKECMKRLTLNINDRLEEEDYQEMLTQTQRPATVNFNRERKHKYQHPKGAPDADLIFNTQKVR